jgi:hypothetical protein
MQKHHSFLTYIGNKLGQICQSYDVITLRVITIFSKREATIPIRSFDRANFSRL